MRCLVLLIALCGTAYAQAPGETPPRSVESKSIAGAYLVTLAATGGPLVIGQLGSIDADDHGSRAAVFGSIGIAGLVFGPSAGHWYVGRKVTTGLVMRTVAAAAIATIVITDPHAEELGLWIVGGIGSVGLWEVGVIWDLVTLPRAVRRYNRNQLQLAPLAAPNTTGLALAGTF